MTNKPPRIDNAPGLTWKPRKTGWEARWQGRRDLNERGWEPKSMGLWVGSDPTEIEIAFIQDRCMSLQNEMLVWGRGGLPEVSNFDGTVAGLVRAYQTDVDSPFRKLRHQTKIQYRKLCNSIVNLAWTTDEGVAKTGGDTLISELKARPILRWHAIWANQGKIPMAHSIITMLRTVVSFGMTFLEDSECERLSGVLSNMRFQTAKSRTVNLTAEQATAIRKVAAAKEPMIALAQALQFELMLRQKDVIGEWVPQHEPGISDVLNGQNKWLRGLRWEEVDANMTLKHVTSKRQKEITVSLLDAPMVLEELRNIYKTTDRAGLPSRGPIILNERGIPYDPNEFRRSWREFATEVGVPKHVRNMDSRAGAITEATDAGVPLEHVRISATHSDIGMTQKYSRGDQEKTASTMRQRVAHRNKTGS